MKCCKNKVHASAILMIMASSTLSGCTDQVGILSPKYEFTDDFTSEIPTDESVRDKTHSMTVGRIDCDFTSIKEALKHVTATRNKIYLLDDVYTESDIELVSTVEIIGIGKSKAIIQASNELETSTGRVFHVNKDATVRMKNLLIRHGKVLEAPRCGAGIFNEGSLTIEDCILRDNTATYGVGIDNRGKLIAKTVMITDNIGIPRPSEDNKTGNDCGGSGGGIKLHTKSVALFEDCIIQGNQSVANGGGVHVACEAFGNFVNCTFQDNQAVYQGGGVSVRGSLEMTDCLITENKGSKGSGLYVIGKVKLKGNKIGIGGEGLK